MLKNQYKIKAGVIFIITLFILSSIVAGNRQDWNNDNLTLTDDFTIKVDKVFFINDTGAGNAMIAFNSSTNSIYIFDDTHIKGNMDLRNNSLRWADLSSYCGDNLAWDVVNWEIDATGDGPGSITVGDRAKWNNSVIHLNVFGAAWNNSITHLNTYGLLWNNTNTQLSNFGIIWNTTNLSVQRFQNQWNQSGQGVGNPFDQDLNSTDNPSFDELTLNQLNTAFIASTITGVGLDMTASPWYLSGVDFTIEENLSVEHNVSVIGNITTNHNITSNYFIGNGSLLTGLASNFIYSHWFNQNLNTTDSPTFVTLTLNGDLDMNTNDINNVNNLEVENDIEVNDKIYHLGDADTYIDFSDNQITLVVGGNTAIDLTSILCNIGLNMTSTQNISAYAFFGDGGNLTNLPGQFWNRTGANVYLYTPGNNVGLGTNVPDNKLEVVGGILVRSALSAGYHAPSYGIYSEGEISVGDDGGSGNELTLYEATPGDQSTIKMMNADTGGGANDGFLLSMYSNNQFKLWLYESNPMVFATDNTERMRIRPDGTPTIFSTGINVNGTISLSSGGSSNNWNTAYNTTINNQAKWNYTNSSVHRFQSQWNSSEGSVTQAERNKWNGTTNIVNNSRDKWNNTNIELQAMDDVWNNTNTHLNLFGIIWNRTTGFSNKWNNSVIKGNRTSDFGIKWNQTTSGFNNSKSFWAGWNSSGGPGSITASDRAKWNNTNTLLLANDDKWNNSVTHLNDFGQIWNNTNTHLNSYDDGWNDTTTSFDKTKSWWSGWNASSNLLRMLGWSHNWNNSVVKVNRTQGFGNKWNGTTNVLNNTKNVWNNSVSHLSSFGDFWNNTAIHLSNFGHNWNNSIVKGNRTADFGNKWNQTTSGFNNSKTFWASWNTSGGPGSITVGDRAKWNNSVIHLNAYDDLWNTSIRKLSFMNKWNGTSNKANNTAIKSNRTLSTFAPNWNGSRTKLQSYGSNWNGTRADVQLYGPTWNITGGVGNPFDQDLNSTDSVDFQKVTTGTINSVTGVTNLTLEPNNNIITNSTIISYNSTSVLGINVNVPIFTVNGIPGYSINFNVGGGSFGPGIGYCGGGTCIAQMDLLNGRLEGPGILLTASGYTSPAIAFTVPVTGGNFSMFAPTYGGSVLPIGQVFTYMHSNFYTTARSWAGGTTYVDGFKTYLYDTGANRGKSYSYAGIRFGTDSDTYMIDNAANGAASSALYIGNTQIQTVSDERVKTNITKTKINAFDLINKTNIVDFNWNDPTDCGLITRNDRGNYTGIIAQQQVNVTPWAVNAPRDVITKELDYKSNNTWFMEYEYLVPVLVQAFKEQFKINDNIKQSNDNLTSIIKSQQHKIDSQQKEIDNLNERITLLEQAIFGEE